MKRVISIISLLLFVLLSTSVQAIEQLKEVTYTVMKHQSKDASIANDYFNKPMSIKRQEDTYIVSFSVNHSHWITEITLDGHQAISKQIDNKLEDTVIYSFKLDEIMQDIPATVKVDIEEELNGEAFSYHNNYPITLKIDMSTQEINQLNNDLTHYNFNYVIVIVLVAGAFIAYKLMKGGKQSNENS